jgi:hypothetical protein
MPPLPQQQTDQETQQLPSKTPESKVGADPLRGILDPIEAPNTLKHDAWDAWHSAKSPEEFRKFFDGAALPQEAKRALWNLKFQPPITTLQGLQDFESDAQKAQQLFDQAQAAQGFPVYDTRPSPADVRARQEAAAQRQHLPEAGFIGRNIPQWMMGPLGAANYVAQLPVRAGQAVGGLFGDIGTSMASLGMQMPPELDPQKLGRDLTPQEREQARQYIERQRPITAGVARGTGETIGELAGNPTNWPFFASSMARPLLQKAIAYGFAAQMAHGQIQAMQNLHDNWDRMSPEQRAQAITQTGLQTLFAGLATKHAGEVTGGGIEAGRAEALRQQQQALRGYQPPAGPGGVPPAGPTGATPRETVQPAPITQAPSPTPVQIAPQQRPNVALEGAAQPAIQAGLTGAREVTGRTAGAQIPAAVSAPIERGGVTGGAPTEQPVRGASAGSALAGGPGSQVAEGTAAAGPEYTTPPTTEEQLRATVGRARQEGLMPERRLRDVGPPAGQAEQRTTERVQEELRKLPPGQETPGEQLERTMREGLPRPDVDEAQVWQYIAKRGMTDPQWYQQWSAEFRAADEKTQGKMITQLQQQIMAERAPKPAAAPAAAPPTAVGRTAAIQAIMNDPALLPQFRNATPDVQQQMIAEATRRLQSAQGPTRGAEAPAPTAAQPAPRPAAVEPVRGAQEPARAPGEPVRPPAQPVPVAAEKRPYTPLPPEERPRISVEEMRARRGEVPPAERPAGLPPYAPAERRPTEVQPGIPATPRPEKASAEQLEAWKETRRAEAAERKESMRAEAPFKPKVEARSAVGAALDRYLKPPGTYHGDREAEFRGAVSAAKRSPETARAMAEEMSNRAQRAEDMSKWAELQLSKNLGREATEKLGAGARERYVETATGVKGAGGWTREITDPAEVELLNRERGNVLKEVGERKELDPETEKQVQNWERKRDELVNELRRRGGQGNERLREQLNTLITGIQAARGTRFIAEKGTPIDPRHRVVAEVGPSGGLRDISPANREAWNRFMGRPEGAQVRAPSFEEINARINELNKEAKEARWAANELRPTGAAPAQPQAPPPRATAPPAPAEKRGAVTLSEGRPGEGPAAAITGETRHDIMRGGEKLGEVHTVTDSDGNLHVTWMGEPLQKGKGPLDLTAMSNKLGVEGLRQVASELKRQNPEAKKITYTREGGAVGRRAAAEGGVMEYRELPLKEAPAETKPADTLTHTEAAAARPAERPPTPPAEKPRPAPKPAERPAEPVSAPIESTKKGDLAIRQVEMLGERIDRLPADRREELSNSINDVSERLENLNKKITLNSRRIANMKESGETTFEYTSKQTGEHHKYTLEELEAMVRNDGLRRQKLIDEDIPRLRDTVGAYEKPALPATKPSAEPEAKPTKATVYSQAEPVFTPKGRFAGFEAEKIGEKEVMPGGTTAPKPAPTAPKPAAEDWTYVRMGRQKGVDPDGIERMHDTIERLGDKEPTAKADVLGAVLRVNRQTGEVEVHSTHPSISEKDALDRYSALARRTAGPQAAPGAAAPPTEGMAKIQEEYKSTASHLANLVRKGYGDTKGAVALRKSMRKLEGSLGPHVPDLPADVKATLGSAELLRAAKVSESRATGRAEREAGPEKAPGRYAPELLEENPASVLHDTLKGYEHSTPLIDKLLTPDEKGKVPLGKLADDLARPILDALKKGDLQPGEAGTRLERAFQALVEGKKTIDRLPADEQSTARAKVRANALAIAQTGQPEAKLAVQAPTVEAPKPAPAEPVAKPKIVEPAKRPPEMLSKRAREIMAENPGMKFRDAFKQATREQAGAFQIGGRRGIPPGAPVTAAGKAVKNFMRRIVSSAEANREAQNLNNRVQDIRQMNKGDVFHFYQIVKGFIQSARNLPEMAKNIYEYREDQNLPVNQRTRTLTPQEHKINDWVTSLIADNVRIGQKLGRAGFTPDEIAGLTHRVSEGKGGTYEKWIKGYMKVTSGNPLSIFASSRMASKYIAMEDAATGNRIIVRVTKSGKVYAYGAGQQLGGDIGLKSEFENAGFKFKRATTPEIETATGKKYYKDGIFPNIAENIAMRRAERIHDFVEQLKQEPEFQKMATTNRGDAAKLGFRAAKVGKDSLGVNRQWLPQFKNYYFEPHIAEVLERENAKFQKGDFSAYERMSNWLKRSIFWNPLLHIPNITVHWQGEKGLTGMATQIFRPSEWRAHRLAYQTMADPKLYHQMLEAGMPLMRQPNTNDVTNLFVAKATKDFTSGGKFDKLAQSWGFIDGIDFAKRVLNPFKTASELTWGVHDYAILQATFSRMEKNGWNLKTAIDDVTKHIPNYRMPPRIWDLASGIGTQIHPGFNPARAIGILMDTPGLTMFSQYHYGAFRSYGEMAKELYEPLKPRDRARAADRIAALGLITYVLYPQADKLARYITGRSTSVWRRAGSSTFVYNLGKVINSALGLQGPKMGYLPFAESVVSPAPLVGAVQKAVQARELTRPGVPIEKAAKKAATIGAEAIGPFAGYESGQATPGKGEFSWRQFLFKMAGGRDEIEPPVSRRRSRDEIRSRKR